MRYYRSGFGSPHLSQQLQQRSCQQRSLSVTLTRCHAVDCIVVVPFNMVTTKRKHEQDPNPNNITASSICDLIRPIAGRTIGEFIMDMARNERLTSQHLRVFTEKTPAFSNAEWEKVARTLGLNPTLDKYQLPDFVVPHAHLPPSFHKQVMKNSMQWLDVYQERGSQGRDAARVRLMDAVYLTDAFYSTS